ncbi:MAG: DUF1636 family protein [Hyphomicrobium sp.]
MTTAGEMPGHVETTLFVCTTCRRPDVATDETAPRPGSLLLAAVEALAAQVAQPHGPAGVRVVPVQCLSNCNHGCTAAITAAGKWTYVVGRLDPAIDAEAVLTFARQHSQKADGQPAWRERPEIGRKNVVARVPPLPVAVLEAAE